MGDKSILVLKFNLFLKNYTTGATLLAGQHNEKIYGEFGWSVNLPVKLSEVSKCPYVNKDGVMWIKMEVEMK